MKKILITFLVFVNLFTLVNADYTNFIDSPNKDDLVIIQDENLRYCEEVFLIAYMRRDFTQEENEKCRNIFAMKIEAELEYKKMVMGRRGIY